MKRGLNTCLALLMATLLCSGCMDRNEKIRFTEFPLGLEMGFYATHPRGEEVIMFDYSDTFRINAGRGLTLKDIKLIDLSKSDDYSYALEILFKQEFTEKLLKMTEKNLNKPLVLVFNDIAYLSAVVTDVIPYGSVALMFDDEELKEQLRAMLAGEMQPKMLPYVPNISERAGGLIATDTLQTN